MGVGRRPIRAACVALIAAAALWQPGAASAQGLGATEASPAGILVINQERLYSASLYGQRIGAEIEEASAQLSAENRRIEAELTAEELELTELRATMDPAEFRALADEFDERVEAIRAAQEAKARNLTAQADAAQSQFFERAAPILLDIVRARGAAVLLDGRSVLLSADRVDITDTAIAALNESLGDGGPGPFIEIAPPQDGFPPGGGGASAP